MINEELQATAELPVLEENNNGSDTPRALFDEDIIHNDEPTGEEYEGRSLPEPEVPKGGSRSIGGNTITPVPGKNEDWYAYKKEKEWSQPLPISILAARLASGTMDKKVKVKKVDKEAYPMGKQRSLGELIKSKKPEIPAALLTSRGGLGDATSTVKGFAENSGAAADALKTFADSFTQNSKNIKTLNKLLSASKGLSRLSSGLGMLGAALGIISILSGEESDTDKILNAISKLDSKLDTLQSVMIGQFDKLAHVAEVNAAKTQLRPHINSLKTLQDLVAVYNRSAKNSAQREIATDRLLEYRHRDILEAVEAIYSQCTGSFTATNIFDATYNRTYGDISAITNLGASLYAFACFANIADSLLSMLKRSREGSHNLQTANEVNTFNKNLYSPMLTGIHAAWENAHQRCIDNFESNMVKQMQADVFPRTNASDHKGAVNNFRNILKDKWFWKDWIVIVYDPIGGFNNHGLNGWGVKSWFRQNMKGGQANIVIKHVDKTVSPGTANQNTKFTHRWVDNGTFIWDKPKNRSKDYQIEDFNWSDVRHAFDKLNPRNSYPGLIWMCKRYKGVWMASTNSRRLTWKNGKRFTICVFH